MRAYVCLLVFALLAVTTPPPQPPPTSPSTPTIDVDLSAGLPAGQSQKVLYVLANTTDPTLQGELVSALTTKLVGFQFANNARPIPEPQWTLAQYVSTCQAFPNSTQGALVAYVAAESMGSVDRFFSRKIWSEITGGAMYAVCTPVGNTGTTRYVWISSLVDGYKDQKPFLLTPSLFVLGIAGTAYATFFPSKTVQTTTTRVYPVTTPIPASGTTSQTQSQNGSTTNASGLNSVAGGLITQYAAANVATPAPAQQGTVWDAVEYVAIGIMEDMSCLTLDGKERSGTGKPAPICSDGPTPRPLATPTPVTVSVVSPLPAVQFPKPTHGPKEMKASMKGAKPTPKATSKPKPKATKNP